MTNSFQDLKRIFTCKVPLASSIVPSAETVTFKSLDFSICHFGKLAASIFRREKVTRPLGTSNKRTLEFFFLKTLTKNFTTKFFLIPPKIVKDTFELFGVIIV